MKGLTRNRGLVLALACLAAYAALVPSLYARPRSQISVEMQVALPRFVQVLMAAGDRFLAANLAGFRALVVSTEKMTADDYHILGLVQSDAAWLNPAHEDNYYIAAAILPWNGELAAAQNILKQASQARPFDWQPAFYYGFNVLHFLKNPIEGSAWMRIAAEHAQDDLEKIQLQQLAANWVVKGDDLEYSIHLHRMMAKSNRNKAFSRFLEKRAVRLENFLALSQALDCYRQAAGHDPIHIRDLLEYACLKEIPIDPFGMRYVFDSRGKPTVFDSLAVTRKPSSPTP